MTKTPEQTNENTTSQQQKLNMMQYHTIIIIIEYIYKHKIIKNKVAMHNQCTKH